MNRGRPRLVSLPWLMLALVCLCRCSDDPAPTGGKGPIPEDHPVSGISLEVIAGSESKHIEPIIKACGRKSGINVNMHYSGSVDMMLGLKTLDYPYDVALPASSIWLRLGDQGLHRIKDEASIMRSPVVLGIKRSMAKSLGWTNRDVYVGDILQAVQSGRLKFAMTSATQSNSGFSSYMGMLIALAGKPDVLTSEHLDQPELQEGVRRLLSGVNRGSGSSGWLMQTFLDDFDRLDAMFNYESMVIAANQELVKMGKEPLHVVYPVDGLAVADCTIGFINKPEKGDNAGKREAFVKLRDCLLSDEVQTRILETGFRAGLIGMNPQNAPKHVFDPAWGIDLSRTISPILWPDETVTQKALTLYQTVFRKPSLTVFAVDCSGSMEGQGLADLKAALLEILDTQRASRYLIQIGAGDITVVIPFDDKLLWDQPFVVKGNAPDQLKGLIDAVESLNTRGQTDIYLPVGAAWDLFKSMGLDMDRYLPAVILMTDGASNRGSLKELMRHWEGLQAPFDLPPVFCIMYGAANDTQLKELAKATYGKVFDGRRGGLEKAFREAKGYN